MQTISNQPPAPCLPFSPCWCEQNPGNPRCEGVGALSIDGTPLIILAVCLMVLFSYARKKKIKNE